MKLTNLKRSIGGAILTASLLFGVGAAASVTAQAQYRNDQTRRDREYEREQRRREREQRRSQRENRRDQRDDGYNDGYDNGSYHRRGRNWDGYGNYGGSQQLRQTALNAGYNEGMKEGRRDRDQNDRLDYADESAYRNASKDYSSRLGDRYAYQRYFREAFANGYRDGYYGY